MVNNISDQDRTLAYPFPFSSRTHLISGGMSEIHCLSPGIITKVIRIAPLPNYDPQKYEPVVVEYKPQERQLLVNSYPLPLNWQQRFFLQCSVSESTLLEELSGINHLVYKIDHGWYNYGGHLSHILDLEEIVGTHFNPRSKIHLADAARLVAHVSRALYVAGSQGIIHRDVKPKNIIYCKGKNPGQGTAYVIDLGLAKLQPGSNFPFSVALPLNFFALLSDTSVERGRVVGTPGYYSPEQARAETLTPSSDAYQLGLVAYNLFMQEAVFNSSETNLVRHSFEVSAQQRAYNNAHRDKLVCKLRERGIPHSLTYYVGQCLDVNPEKRNLRTLEHLERETLHFAARWPYWRGKNSAYRNG